MTECIVLTANKPAGWSEEIFEIEPSAGRLEAQLSYLAKSKTLLHVRFTAR